MDNFFSDCNGNKILLGMFLQNINCDFLTYQVRVRNKKLVLHSGGCYSELTQSKCTMLKIVSPYESSILGIGASLFYSILVD